MNCSPPRRLRSRAPPSMIALVSKPLARTSRVWDVCQTPPTSTTGPKTGASMSSHRIFATSQAKHGFPPRRSSTRSPARYEAPRVWRASLSAQHDRHLLSAAPNGDAPDPALLGGGAFEIARLGNLLIVHGEDDVALAEAKTLRRRAIGDVDYDHAFGRRIEPQLVGDRRGDVGHPRAGER